MNNTTRNPVVTVYYNDALTDRNSDTEHALTGDCGTPFRMSEARDGSCPIGETLIATGQASFAGARWLSINEETGAGAHQPGDPMLKVYSTYATASPGRNVRLWTHAEADAMYQILNIDHPPGWGRRSMSIGDVVVVGEIALAVTPVGFVETILTAELVKEATR